jgi:TolB-like protein/DNA-binding winged helix-turn-helix (wHTH) protein
MIFSINGCTIDTSAYEVRRGDTLVPVEPQVFNLLVLLLKHRDRVVTKDEIFACIWNGRAVSEAALNSRIKSVRQAIGDTGASQALIRTIRGRGFRVVGDVGEGEEGAPDPVGVSPLPEPFSDAAPTRHALLSHRVPPAAVPNGRRASFWSGRMALSLAVALLLVALAGGYLVRTRTVEPKAISATALGMPRGPGIAVLRFAPASAEPEVRFPADAIVEEIATNLTRFSELRVTARALTTEQDGSESDVTEVGRKLGVEFLLKGSVRRGGERLRVSAHLLRTSDGHLLWADTYERVLTPADLFAIQDDIAGKVVATIASLAADVIARETLHQGHSKPPRELGVYECIVRTNEVMNSGFSASTHLSTRTCLEAAVAKEPDYATAWALLAWVHTLEFTYGYNRRPDTAPRELAQAAARRAIDLAPASPIARFAMARTAYILHDLPLFYTEAARALSLNPHDPLLLGIWAAGWPSLVAGPKV